MPTLLDVAGDTLLMFRQKWKNNSPRRCIGIYAFVTPVLLMLRNLYLTKPNWKLINWTIIDVSLLYNSHLLVNMVTTRGRGSFLFSTVPVSASSGKEILQSSFHD